MSISDDGNRGYFVSLGLAQARGTTAGIPGGQRPADLRHERDPGAQAQSAGEAHQQVPVERRRGAQHTIPVKIEGKPYVIFVDEAGSGGFAARRQFAGRAMPDLPPFPMARIIDISDETNPKIVSRLMLEIHDPANCPVVPGSHRARDLHVRQPLLQRRQQQKATTLACGVSTPAFACSTSAIRCGRRRSRTTTPRARRRRAPARITTSTMVACGDPIASDVRSSLARLKRTGYRDGVLQRRAPRETVGAAQESDSACAQIIQWPAAGALWKHDADASSEPGC